MAALPPDHGRHPGPLLDRSQAVEPGHQQGLQRRRDRQRRQQRLLELVVVIPVHEQARLDHHLGQFLNEQRHAVGFGQNLIEHLPRESLTAGYTLDHLPALPPPQPAERQRRDVPVPRPWRDELRPERDHRQHRQALYPINHPTQQLERGRIGPVHVLVQRQHRLARCQACELVEQHLESPLFLLLWAELRERVAPRSTGGRVTRVAPVSPGDPEQVGQQRAALTYVLYRAGEQGLEPVELVLRWVLAA